MNMLGVIGLVLCGMSFILNIVGLAIPYWFYYLKTEGEVSASIYYGLWSVCTEFQEQMECSSYDNTVFGDFPIEFNVTRGLGIMAVITIAGALGIACIKLFLKKDKTFLLQIAGALSLIAGILMIVGAVVFAASDKVKNLADQKLELKAHAGFALFIVSGILSCVGGITFFINK